jgi:hypothetical protein
MAGLQTCVGPAIDKLGICVTETETTLLYSVGFNDVLAPLLKYVVTKTGVGLNAARVAPEMAENPELGETTEDSHW